MELNKFIIFNKIIKFEIKFNLLDINKNIKIIKINNKEIILKIKKIIYKKNI